MEMQGSRTLAVTQQQAWDGLNDPEVLRASIPGCDKVERTGDDRFALGLSVKVGPVAAKFTGKIALTDVQPPERYTLGFEGQGGAAGFGKGTAHVKLVPQGQGCELHYQVHAQVGGKIAQVGQRLIDGVARSMAEDFFKRFEQEMQRRHPAAAPVAAAPEAATGAPESGRRIPALAWILGALALGGAALLLLLLR